MHSCLWEGQEDFLKVVRSDLNFEIGLGVHEADVNRRVGGWGLCCSKEGKEHGQSCSDMEEREFLGCSEPVRHYQSIRVEGAWWGLKLEREAGVRS